MPSSAVAKLVERHARRCLICLWGLTISTIADHLGVKLDLSLVIFSDEIKKAMHEGRYEAQEARAAKQMIERGQTVLEIGAGCGFLSSYIAKLGRDNVIHCVEADPNLIPVIHRHHQMNGVKAQVYNEILANDEGVADFHVHNDFWISMTRPCPGTKRISVRKARLADRLQQWLPECIIVDIEGGELELMELGLPGGVKTLIIELHEGIYGRTGVKRVMDCISNMGFCYAWEGSSHNVLSYRRA